MLDFKISNFMIGDKVKRVVGKNLINGMVEGDIGTITDIKLENYKDTYIQLKEYPGWHRADNFVLTHHELT